MAELVRFHFDPRCPWCWQTSRWARQIEGLGDGRQVPAVDIDVRVHGADVEGAAGVEDPVRPLPGHVLDRQQGRTVVRNHAKQASLSGCRSTSHPLLCP